MSVWGTRTQSNQPRRRATVVAGCLSKRQACSAVFRLETSSVETQRRSLAARALGLEMQMRENPGADRERSAARSPIRG
jgi:hypothetical protein